MLFLLVGRTSSPAADSQQPLALPLLQRSQSNSPAPSQSNGDKNAAAHNPKHGNPAQAETAVLAAPRNDAPDPNGPGENGKPVNLPDDMPPETKKLVDEGWQKNAFNQYVSDMISLHRSLPDPRDDRCKIERYRSVDTLPDTSVIVCFHNEAWTVLLRTVHSVLDRSPPKLIKEVVLVDDDSNMGE